MPSTSGNSFPSSPFPEIISADIDTKDGILGLARIVLERACGWL